MEWILIYEELLGLLQKGGATLLPIFLVAQIGWFLSIERWMYLKKMKLSSKRLAKFWHNLPDNTAGNQKSIQSYLNTVPDKSVFGKMVQSLLSTSSKEYYEQSLFQSAQQILNQELSKLQQHLSTIAIMANAAPLLGLLGTVAGMVSTFEIIEQYGNGNPAMMAQGISTALLTTQAGLVVALPLVLLHNHLLSRIDQIEADCIGGGTKLIRYLSHTPKEPS
jgi:biopolymer transport protein ExbB